MSYLSCLCNYKDIGSRLKYIFIQYAKLMLKYNDKNIKIIVYIYKNAERELDG